MRACAQQLRLQSPTSLQVNMSCRHMHVKQNTCTCMNACCKDDGLLVSCRQHIAPSFYLGATACAHHACTHRHGWQMPSKQNAHQIWAAIPALEPGPCAQEGHAVYLAQLGADCHGDDQGQAIPATRSLLRLTPVQARHGPHPACSDCHCH